MNYNPVIVKKELDDEHFYFVDDVFFPSVTKILGETLPTPYALRQWIGEVGNEKAEAKLEQAGARGSLIHDTCERLLMGAEIKLHETFPKKSDQKVIVGFMNWVAEAKPVFEYSDIERTVASKAGFAGTLDMYCQIKGEPFIVDFKTSSSVYDSHKLQITAYQSAFYEMTGIVPKRMILHLNFKTKSGYSVYGEDKMTIGGKDVEISDFLKVFEVYKMLNGGKVPEPKLENSQTMKTIDYTTYQKPADYIKLEQGDNTIRIISDGYIGLQHGLRTGGRWVNLGVCTELDTCEHCKKGNIAKRFWKWIVVDRKTNTVKLLDAGIMLGDQICQLAKTEDPKKYDITINRTGEKLSTKYVASKAKVSAPIMQSDISAWKSGKRFIENKYLNER